MKPKEGAFDQWDPANISPLVAYLASADCAFTGETFLVQGGNVTHGRELGARRRASSATRSGRSPSSPTRSHRSSPTWPCRPRRATVTASPENVHARSDRTLSFDCRRRRRARRHPVADPAAPAPRAAGSGIDRRWAVLWVVLGGLFTTASPSPSWWCRCRRIAEELDTIVSTCSTGRSPGRCWRSAWSARRSARPATCGVTSGCSSLGLFFAGVFAAAHRVRLERGVDDPVPHLSARRARRAARRRWPTSTACSSPSERVKPLGYWSFVTAGAPVIGVVVGGPLVEAVGWRVIFLIQAPLCLVGLGRGAVVAARHGPLDRACGST